MALRVRVRNLNVRECSGDNGARRLAVFDCDIGAISIFGCTLMRGADGTLFVAMPRRNHHGQPMPAVRVSDGEILHSLMISARDAYHEAGGRLDAGLRQKAPYSKEQKP